MEYDINLLMDSEFESVKNVGDFLSSIDRRNGLSFKELEELIEKLLEIDEDIQFEINEALSAEVIGF